MKILLISYYYKHKNAMASVRAIKLAKFLSLEGHDVTVLTSKQKDTWTKNYLTPNPDKAIREIYAPEVKRWSKISGYLAKRKQRGLTRLAAPGVKTNVQGPQSRKSLKAKLKGYLSWLFYFNVAKQEDVCMFKGLKQEFKKNIKEKYDVVIATYPTYGAFLTGRWLKKKGYCKQFIADFRDPLYNPGFRDRKAELKYDVKCLSKTVNSCDKIVCVSQGIADGIIQLHPQTKGKIEIITNGYDIDDVNNANCEVDFNKEKINFVYAGALYHGKRCVDMLAQALKELTSEGQVKKEDFVFHYAGSDFGEYIAQLKEYGLEDTAVDHGFVSRDKSISMQKNASALLLLTWNESSYQGVVPGKLFEYMSIKTAPIIALITGDVIDSEVAKMIKETNAGFACEQASNTDCEQLKQYVLRLFRKQMDGQSRTEKYDYKNIAKKYIGFIKEN